MTLYVVSGIVRSGTSMMMKALETGGLEACYDLRPVHPNVHRNYHPNVGGYYELNPQKFREARFEITYDEKLVKIFLLILYKFREIPQGMRVVIMQRDRYEMLLSAWKGIGGMQDNVQMSCDKWDEMIEVLKNRKDVTSLNVFNYHKVLERPLEHFQILKDAGWPIDPEKCATVPDKKYCHFKVNYA